MEVKRQEGWARALWLLAAAAVPLVPRPADAQGLTFARGQSVQPAFEGWERNEDGSLNFLFGYLNRNWEEEPDISVGADNFFSPGPQDQGQPTHFLPRRNRFVFRIPVPAGFGENDQLTWTIRMGGEEYTAHASLAPDYYIDKIVIMSETGSIGNGHTNALERSNTPPVSELESPTEFRVRVGEPVTLSVKASDDAALRPRVAERNRGVGENGEIELERVGRPSLGVPGKANGLHVSWFVYRGAGEVTFDPPQIKVWEDTRPYSSPWGHGWMHPPAPEDGRWVTRVTFTEPGTYVLRGKTDDGGLWVEHDVTVHVTNLLP
jgi:hypothetical protein